MRTHCHWLSCVQIYQQAASGAQAGNSAGGVSGPGTRRFRTSGRWTSPEAMQINRIILTQFSNYRRTAATTGRYMSALGLLQTSAVVFVCKLETYSSIYTTVIRTSMLWSAHVTQNQQHPIRKVININN